MPLVGASSPLIIVTFFPEPPMYYTLSELRDSINRKIVEQGESAPVAAFIFTRDDVTTQDDDCNEVTYSDGIVEEVLIGVGDSSYIYLQVLEQIDDEIKEVLKQTNNS